MRFVPRFIADGRAVALDGYIHRVNENVIRRNVPIPSASATLGGLSEAQQGPYDFRHASDGDPVVSVGSSSIKTWHDREDAPDAGSGPTHTVHSTSSVEGLSVGQRLFVERANAHLKAVYRSGDAQPTITPVEARLEGLVIDGVRFTVTLDLEPATSFGTCDEFHQASMQDSRFQDTYGRRVLSLREPSGTTPGKGCFVCSLVDRIEWDGALPPGAEVDEESHVIVWPDFGKVILGEMLISDYSRRLTMVRLELGSPLEGSVSAADVQSGGQGLP
jgi:hypothetical protein